MPLFEIISVALGMALDAFAVSIVIGGRRSSVDLGATFRVAFHFGFFQFLMPILGWFLGWKVAGFIQAFDHWIAFLLLAWIGGKMIYEGLWSKSESWRKDPTRNERQLFILSLVTSIDAFAMGFSLSLLKVDIWFPSLIIGVVTALLSVVGMYFGKYLGSYFGKAMTLFGGCVLCFIGFRILLRDLCF